VILELHPTEHWTPAQFAAETAVWNTLPSLPAVRHHRVLLLADDKLVIPGPRLAESARAIAAALHPEAVR
jgi:ABC-type Fe3+-hydroxamate transport system substrate-binding protein